jgi:DNA-binding CsgD family transcriptional regulator/PAS domain-containing protein
LLAAQHPRFQEGVVGTGDELVDPASLRRTRYAADFLTHIDAFKLLSSYAVRQGTRQSFLSLFRPERAAEFCADERRLYALLVPHFRRAVWLQRRLALAGAQEAALDRLAFGLLLLDHRGQVLFANQAARAALELRDGLVQGAGRLRASDARAATALERLVRAVAAPDPLRPTSAGGVLALPRPSGKLPWRLVASPLPRDLALGLPAGGQARVLLVVSEPDRVPTPPLQQLRGLLGLTRQEARLALLLTEGSELKDAAERLGIGYETARSHLRSALAKAGVRRQSQLVAQVVASTVLRPRG